MRRLPEPDRTDRPGFCTLLKLGASLSILGVIGGAVLAGAGLTSLESNSVLAASLIPAGLSLALQSLLSLAVLQALLWIVDSLLDLKGPAAPAPQAEESIDEELVGRPVLKRRRRDPLA